MALIKRTFVFSTNVSKVFRDLYFSDFNKNNTELRSARVVEMFE